MVLSPGCPQAAPIPHPQGDSLLRRWSLLWVPIKICQSCSVRTSCQNRGSGSQGDCVSGMGGPVPALEGCRSQSEDLAARTSSKGGPWSPEGCGVSASGCREASGLACPTKCKVARGREAGPRSRSLPPPGPRHPPPQAGSPGPGSRSPLSAGSSPSGWGRGGGGDTSHLSLCYEA